MAARKGAPLTMLFCDLDRFKAVNDTYGHAVGDAVLATVARTMADQIRAYDLLARLGGDEFVLLLPDTDPDQAVVMAERIRAAVTEAVAGLGLCGLPGLSVAIGLARYEPGQTIDSLIRQADASMYADKRNTPDT
jgi:diguanylate cyclase (GGDEF)-like protein